MHAILSVIGFIILIAGHQSAWLFAAGMGFIGSSMFIQNLTGPLEETQLIIYSLVLATTFGILGNLSRRIMTFIAALTAGMYIGANFPPLINLSFSSWSWMPIILGGLSCGLAVLIWGPFPLILVTSMLGATIISQNVTIEALSPLAIFITLSIIGLLTQFILWQYNRPDVSNP